ncbi:MAG: two-component regulator propeller domain-containing protein, partial [Bacteroidota bacterium]|nr:two-component regulator propeller domain-containing protein [Bacteroidota bacterium]
MKTLLFALLACLSSTALRAQHDLYRFSRIDISQGLSHNSVTSFLRDEKGFIWIGTVAGLNRYDGYHFKVFRHDQRDSTSISDDYIDNIFEGPGNKLWISTRNGIDIYDPLTDRFDRKKANEFLQSIGIPNGNIIGSISDIKKDALGRFWFLTAGGTGFSATGMYLYDPASRRYARYCHLPADPASPCSNNIACFTLTSNGYWWLVYRDGTLERMDSATGRILWRTNALKQMVGEPSLGYRVFTDRQNDLWIYAPASSQGVYYYNTASGSLRHIDKGLGPFNLNSGIVTGITQDEKGLIWIATDHGGIDLLDKRDLSLHYIMAREEDDKSISQNSINYLYRDREGIIWIGTYKKGFNYYHQDIMKFPLYRHEIPGAKNLNYDDVNRFVEDPKGNLWIGSNGGGLIYYNRRTG